MEKSLVSVVIVNYNGRKLLRDCLQSVFAQTYQQFEVIVVDNGSTDDSVAMVREDFPAVRLLDQGANIGYAAANNRGVESARGVFVALLNNDTVVDPHWLSALLEGAERQDLDIAASLVVTEGVPSRYYERNGTLNYLGYNIMEVFSDTTRIFYASGAALLFSRALVNVPFPDEYFLYHEDVFFSWKSRLMGKKIGMVPESLVQHRGSATVKRQSSSLITQYQVRNRLLNILLLYEFSTLVRLIPYLAFDVPVLLFRASFGRRFSLPGVLRALWWLLAHPGWIRRQRNSCQQSRTIADRQVMQWMSSDLVRGGPGRALNGLSRGYATLVGLARYG